MQLERLELSGELLTCLHSSKSGRCIKYIQTCDGDDCITESPKHPVVTGRKKAKKKKRKPSTGKKEPWRMSKTEWEKAVDATHPGTAFTSKPTKGSGAELDRKLTEHLRLNYDAAIYDKDSGRVIVDHKLMIAKAFKDGKKIPGSILSEYPDMGKFVESEGYKRDRKTLVDSIEVSAKEQKKVAAGKKLLQIDMVYDADLESAIKRVIELKPTTDYYLRVKSPQRTWVESSTPFQGQSYVKVDKNWAVKRFDSKHKLIKSSDLAQNEGVYDSDILTTAEMIESLPADRRHGAEYYLTSLPDNRTKVESKTPGGTGPYIRIDYRGISHFDENRKQIKKQLKVESWKNALQPPNAEKWEIKHPPVMKGNESVPLEPGERLYIISDRSTRKDPGTDFSVVAGEPIIKIEELKQLDLFLHKSKVTKGWWKISDANTGKSITDGDSKAAALKRLVKLAEAVRKEPGRFSNTLEKSRKIYEYPQLREVFERVVGKTAALKTERAKEAGKKSISDPTSDEGGAAALHAERDFMSGLAGDLLTCNKWKILGGPGNEYIRCEEYKRTCQPGDPNCAEPGKAVAKTTKTKAKAKGKKVSVSDDPRPRQVEDVKPVVKKAEMAEHDKYDAVRDVLREAAQKATSGDQFAVDFYNKLFTPTGRPISAADVKVLEEMRFLDTSRTPYDLIQRQALARSSIKSPFDTIYAQEAIKETGHANLNEFWTSNKGISVTPKTTEPVLDIRNAIINVADVKPETIDQLAKRFKVTKDEVRVLASSMADDNAIAIRMQRGSSPLIVPTNYAAQLMDSELEFLKLIKANPGGHEGDIMHATWENKVFVQQVLLELESQKSIKSSTPISDVGSHEITITAKGKRQLARGDTRASAPVKQVAAEVAAKKPVEPEQIWMKENPFTKDDTHAYNRYTFYPIDDLNTEFHNEVKPKLDEVGRLMKEFDVSEIPVEVQTALMWYRRRTYEYLQRKIYSRNNAPGAAIVGPSNYNYTKHKKVIDADKKYWENLETSGRKLETAIKKTITRGRGGKPAVSVKEREKWQEIALKTKRTAFGKLVLENQIAYNKANPDKAPKSIDLSDPKSTFRATVRAQGRNIHARMILDAHQRGLEIDPEVMAQYPALSGNLAGIGTMLQAANALYSLAKVVL